MTRLVSSPTFSSVQDQDSDLLNTLRNPLCIPNPNRSTRIYAVKQLGQSLPRCEEQPTYVECGVIARDRSAHSLSLIETLHENSSKTITPKEGLPTPRNQNQREALLHLLRFRDVFGPAGHPFCSTDSRLFAISMRAYTSESSSALKPSK